MTNDIPIDEILAITIPALAYEDVSTGEQVFNPTIAQLDAMLKKDFTQMTEVFTAAVMALLRHDYVTAGGYIAALYQHIDEVPGPTIATIVASIEEYKQRREQMGEVHIPDFLPTDFRAPSARH